MPDLIAEMVSASNACMRAWEMGDEAFYRALTTPNFRMARLHFTVATRLLLVLFFWCVKVPTLQPTCAVQVIPAYGMDVTGFANVWAVRKSMGDGPLDLHSQHSNYVNGNTVVALGTVFSRRLFHCMRLLSIAPVTHIARSTGKAQQHVEVKYTFDDSGKIALYEQNIIWKE